MNKLIVLSFITLFFISCDTKKLDKTPIEDFIGIWEVQGRSMFDGIEVRIERNDSGELIGKVEKLNDNKYVQMFLEEGSTWVTGIKRSSNYQFKLKERKIASELFSLYGQKTTIEYKAQFINKDLIGLGTGSTDPLKSSLTYKRVRN